MPKKFGKHASLRFPPSQSSASRSQSTPHSEKRPRSSTIESIHDDSNEWIDDGESVVLGGDLDVEEANTRLLDYTLDDDLGEVATIPGIQRLQDVVGYQEPIADSTPVESFSSDVATPVVVEFVTPQGRHRYHQNDPSLLIRHSVLNLGLSDFYIKTALWHLRAGTTKKDYRAWYSIQRGVLPKIEFDALPETIQTLKEHAYGSLPLLDMRKISLALNPDKIPTKQNDPQPKEDMWFFDPRCLFKALLSSIEIKNKMHIGLGEFVDEPRELWHSRSWLSSIRTTSGYFAHNKDSQPVFPSDLVEYRCCQAQCTICNDTSNTGLYRHIGRVLEVGIDRRSSTPWAGFIVIKIQMMYAVDKERRPLPVNAPINSDEVQDPAEAILLSKYEFVPEDCLGSLMFGITVDHIYGSDYVKSSINYSGSRYVRRVAPFVNGAYQISKSFPLCKYHPIRGELEIRAFTRDHFVKLFDRKPCISIPLLTFIDGFGLYRNMYRALMGIYLNIGSFTAEERMHRRNVYPLTLGPHGSNFDHVIKALQSMGELDGGESMNINGQEVLVCPFTICYLGDMPEQAKNSGCLGPKANLFCRFCMVRTGDDIFKAPKIRTHWEMENLRTRLSTSSAAEIKNLCTKNGIVKEKPSLTFISPALDVILTRPSDPPHSEFAGIANQLHIIFMEAYLTPKAQVAYSKTLRDFPMPVGWNRLQNPLHYQGSYSISEHARWLIIIPILLRYWLTPSYIRPHTLAAVVKLFSSRSQVLFPELGKHDGSAFESIVACFASIAKTGSLLMSNRMTRDDRTNFANLILHSRQCFQYLCEGAAVGSSINPSSRASTPTDSGPSTERVTKKSTEYRQISKRPNVHIGLHYPALMEEYGLPSICNVLIGEDMHRFFKKEVYRTNHRDVEKHLLRKENLYRTIRLLLAGSFARSAPDITSRVQRIYQSAPELFDFLVSQPQHQDEDILEDDDLAGIEGDQHHSDIAVSGRIQANYMRNTCKMPCTANELKDHRFFKTELQNAYASGYNMPNIMDFHGKPVLWCKKVSFTDTRLKRLTLKAGNYIRHGNNISKVEHIFTHELLGKKYAFLVVKLTQSQTFRDPVLNLDIRSYHTNALAIVSLMQVNAERLYLVPIIRNESTGYMEIAKKGISVGLVHVDWPITFL